MTITGLLEIVALVADRYEVRGRLGEAPAWIEYRVFDRQGQVELSVWAMDPVLYGVDPVRASLEAAAEAVRGLRHANLRSLFECGRSRGELFVVWKLADGDRLDRRLESGGPADDAEMVRWASAMSQG